MKNYRITVNGNVYDVVVEELNANANIPIQPLTTTRVPVAPVKSPVALNPTPSSGPEGDVKINAPMPGKILSVKVNVGQSVKKGELLFVLEAMKMENEIVASDDGTIANINVSVGTSVEAGDLLASIN